MKLYFIAILPDPDLRERIKGLKLEVKEKYGVKHALKLPPHITLQAPFKFPEEKEPQLSGSLKSFATGQKPFRLSLNGFGSFPPRVIFVKVENHEPVIKLHNELQQVMKGFINPEDSRKSSSIHPHITIATRDLDKEIFKQAWPEFKNRDFEAAFSVESLVLFKHNGKSWEICGESQFSGL